MVETIEYLLYDLGSFVGEVLNELVAKIAEKNSRSIFGAMMHVQVRKNCSSSK